MAGRFSVEAVFKAVDRVTAPVSRMQNRMQKMTRSVERNFRKANRSLDKFVSGLGRASKSILQFGSAATIGAITAVTLALNDTADAADLLAKQSRRLQFPIQDLQEWKFVAEQSGVSNELLDKSLGAFTKRLGEAKNGIGPLVSGLKNANPELLKQLIATDNVAEAFQIYIDAMRNAETATEKAALANAAFSRAGLDLVNIADNSSEAIKALRLEQRLNGNITQQQAEAAEAYNDATNSLKRSLMGLLQGVLMPMLPTITETVREWREWIIANKELISGNIAQFFSDLWIRLKRFIETLRELNKENSILERLGTIVTGVSNAFSFLGEHAGTILKLTAVIVGLSVVFKSLIAVMTLVNLVMAANPITLIALGVAAAIAAFSALVVWIDDVAGAFDNMNPFIRAILAPLELVVRTIKFIKDSLKGGFINTVKDLALSFGFGGDDESANDEAGGQGPQIVSPQDRVARSIEEKRSTSSAEVTIMDNTGRAEVTGGKLGNGVQLLATGTP